MNKEKDLAEYLATYHKNNINIKNISTNKNKELYEKISNNINYLNNYYNNIFDTYINKEYILPSELIILKYFYIIKWSLSYSKEQLNKWYDLIKDNETIEVIKIHNKLNINNKIIDNLKEDSIIIDLYNLYKNEYNNLSFNNFIKEYNKIYKLSESNKLLLITLITIPTKLNTSNNEYNNCINNKKLIDYLNNSYKLSTAITT